MPDGAHAYVNAENDGSIGYLDTVKNVLVIALKDIRDHLAASGHVVSLIFLLEYFL